MVGVLVLVDEHVPEPTAVVLPHVGQRLEQVHRSHDQVVEVEGVGLAQAPLIVRVRRGVGLLEGVARVLGGLFRVAQLVLLVAHPVQDGTGLVLLRVELESLEDQRHQSLGVGRVVDREVGLVADSTEVEGADLLAQDPHARGVERRDPHDPGALADEVLDALLHLGSGLVGEGDRQDRTGVGLALGDQPRDAPGQHPRLAGAGAGHDQQGGAGVHHGGPLRLVEALEQLVGARPATSGAGLFDGRDVLEAGDQVGTTHVPTSLRAGTDSPGSPFGLQVRLRGRATRRSPRRR